MNVFYELDAATAKATEPAKKSPIDLLKSFFCGIFGSITSLFSFILSIFTKPFTSTKPKSDSAVSKGETRFFTIPSIRISSPKPTAEIPKIATPSFLPPLSKDLDKLESSANKELIARKYAAEKLKEIEKATAAAKLLKSPKTEPGRWPPYVEHPAPKKKSVSSLMEADLKGKR